MVFNKPKLAGKNRNEFDIFPHEIVSREVREKGLRVEPFHSPAARSQIIDKFATRRSNTKNGWQWQCASQKSERAL